MELIKTSVSIETTITATNDGKRTFEVIKKLVGTDGEKATIILLYPTRTSDNLFSEDSTINHLVSHMQELHINELRIINLFSAVTNGKMSSRGLEVDKENIDFICSVFGDKAFKNEKFIVAWGNSMSSSFACKEAKSDVLCAFRRFYPKGVVYQLLSDNLDLRSQTAPHPLFLGIRGGGSPWSLAELHITKEMLDNPLAKDKQHSGTEVSI